MLGGRDESKMPRRNKNKMPGRNEISMAKQYKKYTKEIEKASKPYRCIYCRCKRLPKYIH